MVPFGKTTPAVTELYDVPPFTLNRTWLRDAEPESAPQYSPANSTVLPAGMLSVAVLELNVVGTLSVSTYAIV
jgi:hypothetical protein